jgi:exodeoxyribonuclease VII large subunit
MPETLGASDTSGLQTEVYSVSRLNAEVRAILESGLPLIWIEGEISNLARPASGHLYCSLKDDQAQVRCAMFRNRNRYLDFRPADGMQIRARARVSLYEARGEYQLILEHMEEAGHGALQRAYEALKQRLAREDLFDPATKLELPDHPGRIGVISSPTGAALHDILSVLRRRFPALPVLVYPVPVQGTGAAEKIAETIRLASERRDCDVLILARGGGSLEDLWAFNEEIVARAVHACELPLVCGVGHEVDFTIADFVADARAPTPSVAAEMVSPDGMELAAGFRRREAELVAVLRQRLAETTRRLAWLEGRLLQRHPAQRLLQHGQRLDEFDLRMRRAIGRHLDASRQRLEHARRRLSAANPARRTERLRERERELSARLQRALQGQIGTWRRRVEATARELHALSPLATLGRGYAIVRRDADGSILRRAGQIRPDERISARLAQGSLLCRVIEALDDDTD